MIAHKVTILIIDFDRLEADEIRDVIEDTKYPNHCIYPDVYSIESADIGEWSDEHPLNQTDLKYIEWKKYFPSIETEEKIEKHKEFPFHILPISYIIALLRESERIGDYDFIKLCLQAITSGNYRR